MILRNYDNCVVANQIVHFVANMISQGAHTTFGDGQLTFKDIDGVIKKFGTIQYANFSQGSVTLAEKGTADLGLVCGSSDVAVTYDDYNLGAKFDSNDIAYVSYEVTDTTYNEDNETFTRTIKKVFTAKNDITIKEIGFISTGFWGRDTTSNTGVSSDWYSALTYREVLETPVAVPKNSNFTLTFTSIVSANPNKPADYTASVIIE